MSLDLLCHAGLLILALVLATPREERSSVVGMGRSLLGLAGFVLIAALFSTFVMVGFFDFLCTQFPASQWVDMWRYCATLADLRTLVAHGDELVVM